MSDSSLRGFGAWAGSDFLYGFWEKDFFLKSECSHRIRTDLGDRARIWLGKVKFVAFEKSDQMLPICSKMLGRKPIRRLVRIIYKHMYSITTCTSHLNRRFRFTMTQLH